MQDYARRRSSLPLTLVRAWIGFHVKQCNFKAATEALIYSLQHSDNAIAEYESHRISNFMWAWCSDDALNLLKNVRDGYLVKLVLQQQNTLPEGIVKDTVRELFRWRRDALPREISLRKSVINEHLDEIEKLLGESYGSDIQCAHELVRARCCLQNGSTTSAVRAYAKAAQAYQRLQYILGNIVFENARFLADVGATPEFYSSSTQASHTAHNNNGSK
jgi:hypothetical protein